MRPRSLGPQLEPAFGMLTLLFANRASLMQNHMSKAMYNAFTPGE